MKNKSFIYLIPVAALVASCNKKPAVSFSPNPTDPQIREKVTFSNSSSNAVSYSWDFGDGTSSSEQSPTHAYEKEGTYEVTLTAYSKKNKSWNSTTNIVTVQHPEALFTGKVNSTEMNLLAGVDNATVHYDVTDSYISGIRTVVYKAWVGGGDDEQSMGIELGTLAVIDSLTLAETSPFFHSMIKVGDYYFSAGALNGIRIFYESPSGLVWSTDAGTGDQSASNFVITFTEDKSSPDRERFKARFNCTLYDGLGNSKVITDGLFELDFANI